MTVGLAGYGDYWGWIYPPSISMGPAYLYHDGLYQVYAVELEGSRAVGPVTSATVLINGPAIDRVSTSSVSKGATGTPLPMARGFAGTTIPTERLHPHEGICRPTATRSTSSWRIGLRRSNARRMS